MGESRIAKVGPVVLGILCVMWVLCMVDYLVPAERSLVQYGIWPRSARGLLAVPYAWLIHDGILHLVPPPPPPPKGLMCAAVLT